MENFGLTLKKGVKLAFATLGALALASCGASGFNADVSRFQAALPVPQGQSFAIAPADIALSNSLEFAHYADLVKARLIKQGYVLAATPETAQMLVRFSYNIDNGKEFIRDTGFRDPFFDPWYRHDPFYYRSHFGHRGYSRFGYGGGYGSAWGYGYYDPWFDGPRSFIAYTSEVTLHIEDKASGTRLFEGKASALSTSNRLQYLVPNLVEAMFTGFPGNSGETVRISIKPEETSIKRIN